ncbi:MAG TPA: class I SAM-dependent methyltransferase [Candidatus Limnocylindrales bacterium]|nr:class I SAM-dependent methyltransferase [Candidatus Limnocylindrales bacterium]
MADPYYRAALARVHHEGFAFHGDEVAPGVLALLEPVRLAGGLVVELGCGSGLLTRHLVAAGHRVIATDASPAMLDIARETVPGTVGIRRLTLPHDPIPAADSIVAVGHPLNYLPSAADIDAAIVAMARALRPGGILAFDLCDLAYGASRADLGSRGWVDTDWGLVTRFSLPSPDRFVRQMAVFTREADGTWRRDDERHDNVLVDTAGVPALLAAHGVHAEVRRAFGDERLPDGLVAVVGRKA